MVDVIVPAGINAGFVNTWKLCGSWLKGTKCLCVHSFPNSSMSTTTLFKAPKTILSGRESKGTCSASVIPESDV